MDLRGQGNMELFLFHKYLGLVVLAKDFTIGLAVSITSLAIKKKKKALKARESYIIKGKGKEIISVILIVFLIILKKLGGIMGLLLKPLIITI